MSKICEDLFKFMFQSEKKDFSFTESILYLKSVIVLHLSG